MYTVKARHHYRTIRRSPTIWRLKCACGVVQHIDIERDPRGGIADRVITYRESVHTKRVLKVAPPCTRVVGGRS